MRDEVSRKSDREQTQSFWLHQWEVNLPSNQHVHVHTRSLVLISL